MSHKQQQRIEVLTPNQSCVIIKNMIRISISQVCFIRNIFPEECFSTKDYGGLTVRQLEAADTDANGNMRVKNKDAFLLTQWLEKGVFDAIELKYLQSLTFAIFCKDPNTQKDSLVETYQFIITYPDESNGETTFALNGHKVSRDNIKQQAISLVRSLVEFSGTLDQLPGDRWLTLRIQYYDERTPIDYEPEFFKATSMDALQFDNDGTSKLLKVKLGKMESNSHKMELKFAGLEPLLDSEQSLNHAVAAQSYFGEESKARGEVFAASRMGDKGEGDDDETVDEAALKTLAAVRNYVITCSPSLADCSRDLRLSMEKVREMFNRLVEEGTLNKKGTRYVCSDAAAAILESQEINMETSVIAPAAAAENPTTPLAFSQATVEPKKRKSSIVEDPVHQKTAKKTQRH